MSSAGRCWGPLEDCTEQPTVERVTIPETHFADSEEKKEKEKLAKEMTRNFADGEVQMPK